MPEGDSVARSCAALHAALAGRVLTRVELRVPSAAAAARDLVGQRVLEVLPRGKHQLTRLDGGWTIHTHLRMDGTWRIVDADAHTPGPAHEVRALLATEQKQAVGLRLGMVDLVRTDHEDQVVGHLGPDLLGPDWDEQVAVANLLREPGRTIGEALLDQRNLAGIGTIYRAESLFHQRVNPRTPVADVPDLLGLVRTAQRLLAASKVKRVPTASGRDGRWVYGRAGKPCPRCRTRIQCEEFGPDTQERLSWWCPRCQPLG
ncbi:MULTISPECIES: Fpg/Nei family DNA glycosylase [unclassified Luteococcus]|uniref:Fpg/Nei family DNA glycosylase n=1 Tax=unclassified Luteococcus TaxID=2639923 RepID=UPI00313E8DDA